MYTPPSCAHWVTPFWLRKTEVMGGASLYLTCVRLTTLRTVMSKEEPGFWSDLWASLRAQHLDNPSRAMSRDTVWTRSIMQWRGFISRSRQGKGRLILFFPINTSADSSVSIWSSCATCLLRSRCVLKLQVHIHLAIREELMAGGTDDTKIPSNSDTDHQNKDRVCSQWTFKTHTHTHTHRSTAERDWTRIIVTTPYGNLKHTHSVTLADQPE